MMTMTTQILKTWKTMNIKIQMYKSPSSKFLMSDHQNNEINKTDTSVLVPSDVSSKSNHEKVVHEKFTQLFAKTIVYWYNLMIHLII